MEDIYFEGTAPGRLDVMGGIADYSGSLVLQMPIKQKTTVSIALRDDYQCILQSDMNSGETLSTQVDYRNFLENGEVNYEFAQQQFNENKDTSWIAYVIGCALVLQKEKGINFKGASIKVNSSVPLGKGVSSSASLEVATMKALKSAYNLSFSGTELPVLAQKVENLIVGAPCGLMDQLASFFGESGKIIPIICQPDLIEQPISIPDNISFMGIDSGIRHSVQGASYGDVRCAAFMGYSIIANACGVGKEELAKEFLENGRKNLPYQGYLCNISKEEFEKKYEHLLPKSISGKEFISKYGETIDHVTHVSEDKNYDIYSCTRHPVLENERVKEFRNCLLEAQEKNANRDNVINRMGQIMLQSHESYSACGLGSSRTDEIIALAKLLNNKGIIGGKITGGGSGGTVCLLAIGETGKQAVRDLHFQLSNKYNQKLVLFEN